jgi:tetrahydromethanopterin S-methyltransferase subunit G
MNLQENIRKVLKEDRKLSNFLRRRLHMLDYEVEYYFNEIEHRIGPYSGIDICVIYKNGVRLFETIMETAINAMYYNHFSHIDDNSGEWAHEYLDMVDYIRNKYQDKIMKYYDDNCGSGSIPIKESIRKVLREEVKTKSTSKEFSKYKDSWFNSLRDYTLQDIVDNWDTLSNHKNDNIQTIKYFVENPDKIDELIYDKKGLEDGYHRLIAMKILKKPKFKYKLVESIRKVLKEETTQVDNSLLNIIKEFGLYSITRDVGLTYSDVWSKTGELPREIKIQYLKDLTTDQQQTPHELDLTYLTGSIPLYENDNWQTVYVEYLSNKDNVLRVHLAEFDEEGGVDNFDIITEDELDGETLDILVNELSDRLHHSNKKTK